MTMLFILLVIYQLKHFFADYPLQGTYMLGKFKPFPGNLGPLTAHAAVHGLFTLVIALCVNPWIAFQLALLDMIIHWIMDLIKANPSLLGRFKALSGPEIMRCFKACNNGFFFHDPDTGQTEFMTDLEARKKIEHNKYFWWALGLDQMVHHLTHYVIIAMLLGYL